MWRPVIIICAIALYLVSVGCTFLTSDPTGAPRPAVRTVYTPSTTRFTLAEGLPYRAIGMQIQRTDWMDNYKKSVDEIAATGADAVKFVVDARQENGESSRIYLDMRMTPTPDQLGDLIRYARSKNLRVILMPIVLLDAPRGTEWRGQIRPSNWNSWWESYREILTHFSWIAQANGVDILVIGSELVSTEDKTDEWIESINQVRKVFKGKLTYSSNWDHYTHIKFWDQLDFIGMNSYWKLGDSRKASVAEIKDSWTKIQAELFEFQDKINKPIYFLEVGWCSMANMAYEPWDYTKDESDAPTDVELQARLYQGFFESWHGSPRLGGFSIWEWTPGDGGEDDRGYTPENKPAEKVLREWFAKPWK